MKLGGKSLSAGVDDGAEELLAQIGAVSLRDASPDTLSHCVYGVCGCLSVLSKGEKEMRHLSTFFYR